ncbi:MAG TPA: hypothetical protein VFH15_03080 [Pyrinomonadaceae bacterium]|nr:hypothetical protein [Pyrinomonadaceae bacterium]
MRFRGAGRAFIATGVIFIFVYILVSLYGLSAKGLRIGTLLLYVGIVLFIVGLSLRLARRT